MARCAEWSHRILRHTLCSVLADSLFFFVHNTETYHVSISKNNFPRVGKPVGRWYFGTGDTTQILKIQGNTSQWDKMVKTWFDHIHSNLICPGLISVYIYILCTIEGSLEVKLPTIWTDEKQRWEESEKRREEERRSKKRKSQKKEDPGARKGRKVAIHCVFPMICGSGGSKSSLLKRRVRSQLAR